MCHFSCVRSVAVLTILLVTGCSHAPADDVIAAQIKAKFFSDPNVKTAAISVAVNRGEVTLAGTVGSVEVQLVAFKLALDTQGVRKLNDRMLVSSPSQPQRRAAPLSSAPIHQALLNPTDSNPARSSAVLRPPADPFENTPAQSQIQQDQIQVPREIVPHPSQPQVSLLLEVQPRQAVMDTKLAPPDPGDALPPASQVTEIAAAAPREPLRVRAHSPLVLLAAGATFPAMLYQNWFLEFHRADPQTEINYQAIGSGGGVRMLIEGIADLGAVDWPVTDKELARIPDGNIVPKSHFLHFPVALGGIVPICNISGVGQPLNFSGEVLAAIFSGRITRWDDPAIKILNQQTFLPSEGINVVHRSDGAAATLVFTDYLSTVSSEWQTHIGAGSSLNWPVGMGAKGNDGVSGLVKQTPGAIGYVEFLYALQNRLQYGPLQNRSGKFVKASLASLTAAATKKAISPDFRVSLADAEGPDAYPLASFTWLIVPDRLRDPNKKDAIVSFLQWMLTRGQDIAGALNYAPLPKELAMREQAQIRKIN